MVVNGMTEYDRLDPLFSLAHPLLLYENGDDGSFQEVNDDTGSPLARSYVGRGGAWADYDSDGDVDIVVGEAGEAPTHLFRSDAAPGNFLTLDLRGSAAGMNRDALGAKVTVRNGPAGLQDQFQEKVAGSGFLGSSDPRLHFGLGAARAADVEVRWPDGSTHRWPGLRANTFYRVVQGLEPEALRTLPFVAITAPAQAQRATPVTFRAQAEALGAGIASVAWEFGDGGTALGTEVTHVFDDFTQFTVRATATDTLGRAKTTGHGITITETLLATVAFDRPAFLPVENATGNVTVRDPRGAAVPFVGLSLQVDYGSGEPALDAAAEQLPRAVRTALGYTTRWVNGTTDAQGQLSFAVPRNLQSPMPLLPLGLNQPGLYTMHVTGGARGSAVVPVEATYRVGVAP
jgi:hypothetical protein